MMDISNWSSAFLLRYIHGVDTGISRADNFALNRVPGLAYEYFIKNSHGRAC